MSKQTKTNQPFPQISRAFKQAPWRVETQVIAGLAATLIVMIAISGMYLAETSRAATAGRDVQNLELLRDDLIRQNDQLRASIATTRDVEILEARARAMGFVPATVDDLAFIELPADVYEPAPVVDEPPPAVSEIPAYNETLGEWLMRNINSAIGGE